MAALPAVTGASGRMETDEQPPPLPPNREAKESPPSTNASVADCCSVARGPSASRRGRALPRAAPAGEGGEGVAAVDVRFGRRLLQRGEGAVRLAQAQVDAELGVRVVRRHRAHRAERQPVARDGKGAVRAVGERLGDEQVVAVGGRDGADEREALEGVGARAGHPHDAALRRRQLKVVGPSQPGKPGKRERRGDAGRVRGAHRDGALGRVERLVVRAKHRVGERAAVARKAEHEVGGDVGVARVGKRVGDGQIVVRVRPRADGGGGRRNLGDGVGRGTGRERRVGRKPGNGGGRHGVGGGGGLRGLDARPFGLGIGRGVAVVFPEPADEQQDENADDEFV